MLLHVFIVALEPTVNFPHRSGTNPCDFRLLKSGIPLGIYIFTSSLYVYMFFRIQLGSSLNSLPAGSDFGRSSSTKTAKPVTSLEPIGEKHTKKTDKYIVASTSSPPTVSKATNCDMCHDAHTLQDFFAFTYTNAVVNRPMAGKWPDTD